MEPQFTSEYASFLSFSTDIYLNLGIIKNVIISGMISFIFAFFQIIDLYYKIIPSGLEILFYLIWLIMIVIFFHDGYNLYKFLNQWGESFFRMFYILNFELFKLEGKNPPMQLFNKIYDTFIDYFKPLEAIDQEELETLFTDKTIEGEEKEHHFDIFIHRKLLDKKISWQRKIIELYQNEELVGYIIGKIYQKTEPVGEQDLKLLRNEIIDSTKTSLFRRDSKDKPFRIIVVSNSSFSEDAIEYVKSLESRINNKPFDLILQEEENYKIIYTDYFSKDIK